MNTVYKVTIAIALLTFASTSTAKVRASYTRAGDWLTFDSSVLVPLTDRQATGVSFDLPASGKKVLTYSASCNAGGDVNAYIDLDIVVNGVVVAPTVGGEDSFCGSDARNVRPSITLVIQGVEGPNTVKIVLKKHNGATGVSLGASSLVIHD